MVWRKPIAPQGRAEARKKNTKNYTKTALKCPKTSPLLGLPRHAPAVCAPPEATGDALRETPIRDACDNRALGPPLLSLRGPLAGPAPARCRYRNRTVDRGVHGHSQPVVQPFLQHAARPQLGHLRQRDFVFLRAGCSLHRALGLPELSELLATDSVATMDDADLFASVAQQRHPLPHAATRRRRRQSRPAHCRRLATVRATDTIDRHWNIELDRDAVVVHRHSMDFVARGAAASVRLELCNSGIPGLGGADLCRNRDRAHAPHRLAADSAQFPAAAV